jgi:hypothetical protein
MVSFSNGTLHPMRMGISLENAYHAMKPAVNVLVHSQQNASLAFLEDSLTLRLTNASYVRTLTKGLPLMKSLNVRINVETESLLTNLVMTEMCSTVMDAPRIATSSSDSSASRRGNHAAKLSRLLLR